MKKISKLAALLCASVALLGFVSCSDDDEDSTITISAESVKGKALTELTKVGNDDSLFVKGDSYEEISYEVYEEPTSAQIASDEFTLKLGMYIVFKRTYAAIENGTATLYTGTINKSSETWDAETWNKYKGKKASSFNDSDFTWKKASISISDMSVYKIGDAYYTISGSGETKAIPGTYDEYTYTTTKWYKDSSYYEYDDEKSYVDDDGNVWNVSYDTSKGTATFKKTDTKLTEVSGTKAKKESFETDGFKETTTFTPTDTKYNAYTKTETSKYGSGTGNGIIEVKYEEDGSGYNWLLYYDGTKLYDEVDKFTANISAIPDYVKENAK